MFPFGLGLALFGGYFVDSAIRGRAPLSTLAQIIRDPSNVESIIRDSDNNAAYALVKGAPTLDNSQDDEMNAKGAKPLPNGTAINPNTSVPPKFKSPKAPALTAKASTVRVALNACLHDVSEALLGKPSGLDTAADAWAWALAHGDAHEGPPPAGSVAIYLGGTDGEGHAVVGIGKGFVLSPGVPVKYKWNRIYYTEIGGDLNYAGYITALPSGKLKVFK